MIPNVRKFVVEIRSGCDTPNIECFFLSQSHEDQITLEPVTSELSRCYLLRQLHDGHTF